MCCGASNWEVNDTANEKKCMQPAVYAVSLPQLHTSNPLPKHRTQIHYSRTQCVNRAVSGLHTYLHHEPEVLCVNRGAASVSLRLKWPRLAPPTPSAPHSRETAAPTRAEYASRAVPTHRPARRLQHWPAHCLQHRPARRLQHRQAGRPHRPQRRLTSAWMVAS